MPCARMPSLMPALQPLSASRWQRATGVTGPWRSSCIPVVRDGPHGGPALIRLRMACPRSSVQLRFRTPGKMNQVISEDGPREAERLHLQGPSGDRGLGSWGSEAGTA